VDCRKSRKLIDLYLDGEADDSQTKTMFSHMEKCSKCQARFKDLQKLHNTMTSVSDAKLPSGFRNSVMQSIRVEESEQRHRPVISHPAIIWGSVAVVVLLALTTTWRIYHTREAVEVVEAVLDVPEIHIVSPREDSVVDRTYVDISAAYDPASADSIRVILDGRDVTEATEVNEDFLIHATDELQSGYHIAIVQVMGNKGTPITQRSWAFYIMKTQSS